MKETHTDYPDPPKLQLIFAVFQGIMSGELKLCEVGRDHQIDRHSPCGWVELFILVEEGWSYDRINSEIYPKGKSAVFDTVRFPPYLSMKRLGITGAEHDLLFNRMGDIKDQFYVAKLIERGFRFNRHLPDEDDQYSDEPILRRNFFYFYTYEGVDEQLDINDENRRIFARQLWNRYFPTEKVEIP